MRDELRAEMKSEIRSVKNGNQLQIQVFGYFCIVILGQAIILILNTVDKMFEKEPTAV